MMRQSQTTHRSLFQTIALFLVYSFFISLLTPLAIYPLNAAAAPRTENMNLESGAPAEGLPDLDTLRNVQSVIPEASEAEPSTLCSPSQPDCSSSKGTMRRRLLSPKQALVPSPLDQMLGYSAHHSRRKAASAPQTGDPDDDFVMARLDPDNRIGTGGDDPLSRNFNWSLPLVGMNGRSGLGFGVSLSYNSLVWTRSGSYITYDADKGFPTPGFRLGFPTIYGLHYNSQTATYGYLVLMPSGARVELRRQINSPNIYEAADSSYLFLVDNGGTLLLRSTDGTQLTYSPTENGYRCTQVKDRNGNYLTVNHNSNGRLTSVTDTLGRVFNFNYDSNQNLETITQTRGTTPYEWVRFFYTNLTIQTNFTNLTVVGLQNGTTLPVLSKVRLADGTYYKFSYTTWGQVHKITYYAADSDPQLDNHALNYVSYNLPLNATTAQTDCPRFTQRNVWAENWNYSLEATTNYTVPAAVTQLPDGTQGSWTFCQMQTPDGTYYNIYSRSSGWDEGLPVLEDTWADEGQGLSFQRRVKTEYTQDNTGAAYRLNPRVTETNVYDAVGNRRRNSIGYSSFSLSCGTGCNLTYHLPSETKEYAANATDVLRTTQTDYNTNFEYTSQRIFGLVSQMRVYNTTPSTGNLVSKVSYIYDDGGEHLVQQGTPIQHDATNYGTGFVAGRGNVTRMQRYDVSNSQYVEAKVGYNTTGSTIFTRTPLQTSQTQVNIIYTDSFSDSQNRNTYAYPTEVLIYDTVSIYPLVAISNKTQYDYHLGATTRKEGPPPAWQSAGAVQTVTYDSVGRIERLTNTVNSSYTRYVYPTSSNTVHAYTTIKDAQTETVSAVMLDGAGNVRGIAKEHPGSIGGYIGQYFAYDVMGRLKQQTNPTEIYGSWITAGDDAAGWVWSVQTYDWKGRPRISTNQDGTTRETTYGSCGCAGGEVITTSSEQLTEGKRRQKIYHDVLGRVQKIEDLNWNQNVYRTTTNIYNARDQISETKVYQGQATSDGSCPSGTCQKTLLTYDGHGRLATGKKPIQSSPTSYIYNNDDTLYQSTDARGATTTYSYNNRRQVTGITYSAPTPITASSPIGFGYDSAGNRMWMTDGTGRVDYYYDALSRLTSETKQITGITSRTFTTSYTYNVANELTSLTDPFGAVTSYLYDVTGRLTKVTGTGFNTAEYISQIDYRAWGGRKRILYGNNLNVKFTYNPRLNISRYEGLEGTTVKMGAEYQFHADGKIRFSDDLTDPKLDRSYTYDNVGRLSQARSGAEAQTPPTTTNDRPYSQVYEHDVWNNITVRGAMHWDQDVSFGATYLNDRNVMHTYDASGNDILYDLVQGQFEADYEASGQRRAEAETRFTEDGSTTLLTTRKFDGDGQIVREEPLTFCNTCPPPSANPMFFVRSTVLGGEPVASVNQQGQALYRYVYTSGGELLGSMYGSEYQNFEWRHYAPSGSGIWKSAIYQNNLSISRTELDPVSADVGTENPYTGGGGPGGGGNSGDITSRLADASDFSRCSLDGVRVSCNIVLRGLAADAVVVGEERPVTTIRFRHEKTGRVRYRLGIYRPLPDGGYGYVPIGAKFEEGNYFEFDFKDGSKGIGRVRAVSAPMLVSAGASRSTGMAQPQDSGSIWGNDWQKLRYQGVSLSPCAQKVLSDIFDGSNLNVKDLRFRIGIPQLILDFATIRPDAVTIGNDIYVDAGKIDLFDVRTVAGLTNLAHEAWHALQYANGMTKTAYLRESFRQWRKGKDPYWDNKYEKDAYEADELIEQYIRETYGENPCKTLGLSPVAK